MGEGIVRGKEQAGRDEEKERRDGKGETDAILKKERRERNREEEGRERDEEEERWRGKNERKDRIEEIETS